MHLYFSRQSPFFSHSKRIYPQNKIHLFWIVMCWWNHLRDKRYKINSISFHFISSSLTLTKSDSILIWFWLNHRKWIFIKQILNVKWCSLKHENSSSSSLWGTTGAQKHRTEEEKTRKIRQVILDSFTISDWLFVCVCVFAQLRTCLFWWVCDVDTWWSPIDLMTSARLSRC